jgi:APA family basic amino acid/polyamine antiporter
MATSLKPKLGLLRLTFYGVGTIVGAGIYSVIGAAAGEAGYGLWISFILAGIAASFSALSYAELASTFPKAGAEYLFLKKALPEYPFIAFLVGFVILLHGAATIATVALAFAGYLDVFVAFSQTAVALTLVAAFTALNIAGIRLSSAVNIAFVSIQLAGLLGLVVLGVRAPSFASEQVLRLDAGWGIIAATSVIFFIYTGYEHMASLGEEVKEPGKTIHRAFLLALILTTAIYLAIVFAVLALAEPQALASSKSPLTLAAGNAIPWMGGVIAVAALCATANAALSGIISASRMLFGMARDKDMPAIFARLLPGRDSPWTASVALLAGIALLVPLGEIKTVASMSSLGALFVFIGVNTAVIVLRYREPALQRPFRTPLAFGRMPVIPLLGIIVSIALATQFSWDVYLFFCLAAAVGVVVYFIKPLRRRDAQSKT